MIVVVGRIRTDADRREELVRIGQAVAGASRGESGCISCRLYEDTEVENDFVFVEEWESSEALRQHSAAAHVAEFMRAIPRAIVAPPDVKFHTIESSMDLADLNALVCDQTVGGNRLQAVLGQSAVEPNSTYPGQCLRA